ncbi:hypothetical protein [Seohaeicola zhoushanensis]|uniref:Uncharacterized protein n=1 Tax=Seohaeicola zhoushanensis TaxID=1569283 RepID=A0A8J3GYA4_9RHOB|nr:hypothetical protein [Seohaeicola zhoushanensis]GHF50620.1 hypothetical protein GCM10017056_22900 [Seohaeicola zhoushanensis]
MTNTCSYHGGLVMFASEEEMLERLSRIAATSLEDYGHPVEKSALIDACTARVVSSRYAIKLSLTQDLVPGEDGQRGLRFENFRLVTPAERQHRVVIELFPADTRRDDREISELLMVVMLYRAAHEFDVQMIEWLDPLTLLTTAEFLTAFANVGPNLVPLRVGHANINDDRFAPEDEIALHAPEESAFVVHLEAVEVDPDQSDVRRLAIWGMTCTLATLSTPVALSMAAVNLVRGEDFRLNTHVLALTGFLVMLQSTGALASAIAVLPL